MTVMGEKGQPIWSGGGSADYNITRITRLKEHTYVL
jgi:hypothetical protein